MTPALGHELEASVAKAARYYATLGYGSFAAGNAEGGLTTIEEKSMGAYAKSGASPISGLIKPGDIPPRGGLYLLDVVPDGEVRWGFPNINDNAEIAELIACGSHAVLFVTGRGSVVGSAISPVIKICANPETYRRMADDMDVDAGRILEGEAGLDEVGAEIRDLVLGARRRQADEVGRARPPGVHPHLQIVRADRSRLPAGGVNDHDVGRDERSGEQRSGPAGAIRPRRLARSGDRALCRPPAARGAADRDQHGRGIARRGEGAAGRLAAPRAGDAGDRRGEFRGAALSRPSPARRSSPPGASSSSTAAAGR